MRGKLRSSRARCQRCQGTTINATGRGDRADAAYGYHDWEYILGETRLLWYDHTLAYIANGLGIVFMLASFLWAGAVLLHQ
jgi:hypothetical protein